MTLTTHIIIGAAVTKPLMTFNPGFAFLAALVSHYLSDAIPHWDYDLTGLEDRDNPDKRKWGFTKKTFFTDFSHTALDALIGAAFIFVIFPPTSLEILFWNTMVIIGSVLPDFLNGLYFFRRPSWLRPINTLHDTIHTKIKLRYYPLIGIPLQLIILLIFLYFLF